MRAAGLKTQIILNLLLLLAAAMLLANLVISLLWQQSLLRMEIQKNKTILAYAARQLSAELSDTPTHHAAMAQALLEDLGAECLHIRDWRGASHSAETSCSHSLEIDKAMHDSISAFSDVVTPIGSTWNLFSLQPERLLISVPFHVGSETGAIAAVTSLRPVYTLMRQKQKTILVYLLVNILLLATIGFFRLAKSMIRPLERLVQRTEAYDESDEFLLTTDQEANEFSLLSASINRMTRRIDDDRMRLRRSVASLEAANAKLRQAQQEMVRAEKLAAVGRLSAGLAHEIGNPIGIVQGYLELLQRDSIGADDRLQFSQRAIEELDRINRLIRQLLDFARTAPPGTQPVAMNGLIRSVVDMFKNRRKMEKITFRLYLDASHDLVEANEESLRQVLLNCLLNSVDAVGECGADYQGEIILATRNPDANKPEAIEISILDNGCGIDQAQINNIFDPFFTTKEPGKGTGLGLAVSLAIVEAAGGRIRVASEVNKGTEFRITFPCAG